MDITSYLVSDDNPGHGPFGAQGMVSDETVTSALCSHLNQLFPQLVAEPRDASIMRGPGRMFFHVPLMDVFPCTFGSHLW